MAEAKTDPTDDLPSKTGPSNWLLIVDDVFPRWRDRLGSSRKAVGKLYDLLCDAETHSAKHRVDASGEEIPDTNRHVDHPGFWQDRLLLVADADGGDDHLKVNYTDDADVYLDVHFPGGHWKFYVRRRDVEHWERLDPELAAAPPTPSKEPTPSEALSNKLRQKPGRKPDFDWEAIEAKCYALMDHHGDFTPDDPDWDCQARLEIALMRFCQEIWRREPGPSTLRERLPDWLSAWRWRKTSET
jgi:hypothetical protein